MQSPLRKLRKSHGFTLSHVASGVLVDPATLSRIERCEQVPSVELAERFSELGYALLATEGTADYFKNKGLKVETVGKIGESSYSVLDAVYGSRVDVIINTTNKEKSSTNDGFKIRRAASEQGIVCLTSLDTTNALLKVLESMAFNISAI